MYYHDTRYTAKNQSINNKIVSTEEEIVYTESEMVLSDRNKKGKDRGWKERKDRCMLLAECYKRIGLENKYNNLVECCTSLEFLRKETNSIKKCISCNCCKSRLCPLCMWRQANKLFGHALKIINKALEEADYKFAFLTLTQKNCSDLELDDQITKMYKAFDRLMKRQKIKRAIEGYFRVFEITYKRKDDSYHPHFHVLLMVKEDYFEDADLYIEHEEYKAMWKKSLKIDYDPFVNVKRTYGDDAQAVAELCKYPMKDTDYIYKDDIATTDKVVFYLTGALKHRRLTAWGGRLKEIYNQLKLEEDNLADDIDVEVEQEEEYSKDQYIIEKYSWHFALRQYVRVEDVVVHIYNRTLWKSKGRYKEVARHIYPLGDAFGVQKHLQILNNKQAS